MKRWTASWAGLVVVALGTPELRAQFAAPGIPAAPAAVPGVPLAPAGLAPAVPVAPVAAPRTLWSFLGLSKDNLAACKAKFCQSQLGLLATNGLKPISALTGGIIPSNCCPPLSASQLAAGDGVDGGPGSVAAQIQADEAGAKARIAAIEYLATVDCNYWPEAGEALVKSLRADRNECVRFAAAKALGTGCCCTKDTVAALTLTVSGASSDDNPPENSERVKAAAYYALQRCLACVPSPVATPPERPGRSRRPENPVAYVPDAEKDGHSWLSPYKAKLEARPLDDVMGEARRVLAASAKIPLGEKTLPTGSRSIYHVLARASIPSPSDRPEPATKPPIRRERHLEAPLDRAVVPSATTSPAVPPPLPPLAEPAPPPLPPPPLEPPAPPLPPPPDSSSLAPRAGQRSLLEILQASRKPRQGS